MRSLIRLALATLPFLFVADTAFADPATAFSVFTWIGATLSSSSIAITSAFQVIGMLIYQTAIVIGLNYVAQSLLAGGARRNSPQGVKGQAQSGGDVPKSIIVGKYATAGSLIYAGTWGQDAETPNAYYTAVYALSDLPVNSLKGLFVNEARVTWTSGLAPEKAQGTPIIEYRKDGQDYLWLRFHYGANTVVDDFLYNTFSADPEFPYTSDMIGTGICYVMVTARVNRDLFPNKFPEYLFELEGIPFYDPRKDSTNGGVGAHRFNNAATWEYSDNPQVINYNITRGIYYNATAWMWGGQTIQAAHLPTSSWFAGMNACDLTVLDIDGVTSVKQYRAGGEVSLDMLPVDVIESFNTASNARVSENGGYFKLLVGAAGSSVFAFTDGDIMIDYDQDYFPFPDPELVINGILPTYPEPEETWGTKEAPIRVDAVALAADGQKRIANINYGTVPYVGQVERLAQSALNEQRKFRKHTFVLGPRAWPLEPNDVVTYTSSRNSYTSKAFIVAAVTDNDNGDVLLILVETDPADYDFNTGTDYDDQDNNPTTVNTPPTVAPNIPGGFGNGIVFEDGAVTAADATFTSLTTTFHEYDEGKSIWIMGAGASGATLLTTILTFVSANVVELATNASTTVTAAHGIYGSNDGQTMEAYWLKHLNGVLELGQGRNYLIDRALVGRFERANFNGSKLFFGIANHTDDCVTLFAPIAAAVHPGGQVEHRYEWNNLYVDGLRTGRACWAIRHGSPTLNYPVSDNSYEDGFRLHVRASQLEFIENCNIYNPIIRNAGARFIDVYLEGDGVNGVCYINETVIITPEGRSAGRVFAGGTNITFHFQDTSGPNQKISNFSVVAGNWDYARSLAVGAAGTPFFIDTVGTVTGGVIEGLQFWGKYTVEDTSGSDVTSKLIDASATAQSVITKQLLNMGDPIVVNWGLGALPDWYLNEHSNVGGITRGGERGRYIEDLKKRPDGYALASIDAEALIDSRKILNSPGICKNEKNLTVSTAQTFDFDFDQLAPGADGFADPVYVSLSMCPFPDGTGTHDQHAEFICTINYKNIGTTNHVHYNLLDAPLQWLPGDLGVDYCFSPDAVTFAMVSATRCRCTVTGGGSVGSSGANVALKFFAARWGQGLMREHQGSTVLKTTRI